MKAPKFTMNGAEVMDALRRRYAPPEYAFLEQVRSRTGYGGEIRTADAMAMSLWPGRGIELIGCEVKIDRRDWIREKKTPEKAEEIVRHCDRWWLVVSDESIVRVEDGELPPTWGLLVPGAKKGTLRAKVDAPKLEPGPLPRPFLAAILRNVEQAKRGMVPRREMEVALEAARDEVRNAPVPLKEKSQAERELALVKRDLEAIRDTIERFEEASGVKLDLWDGPSIGKAVHAVRMLGLDAQLDRARRVGLELARVGKDIADTLKNAEDATTVVGLAVDEARHEAKGGA